MKKLNVPKVLIIDIETAPILGYVWSIWQDGLGINEIKTDWRILSWAAKWLNDPASKIMYQDQRHAKDMNNDKPLLTKIWSLIDEADIIIAQNGNSFDIRKLNARFIQNGLKPPSSFKKIDTKLLAQKHFAFTSHKLEYMTDRLCKKYKKLKHKKFPGFELWTECLKGNQEAWRCMAQYNKHDVLALEELYHILAPWDSSVNWNLYHDSTDIICKCGSREFKKQGFGYTGVAKYQRYRCKSCGSETRSRENLFSKEKRKSLRVGTRS